MDELNAKINDWTQYGNTLQDYDTVIENFLLNLEQECFVSEVTVDKTPKQPKKKRNVLSTINNSTNVESNESSEKVDGGKISITKKSLDPIMQHEHAEKDVLEPHQDNSRPGRAAKGKAKTNLKELKLNVKMRNDVKLERISAANKSDTQPTVRPEPSEENHNNSDPRLPVDSSEHETTEIRHSNNKKVKLSLQETSIELVPSSEIKIELLSDEEKDKMPPPSHPPLKTKKKTKQANKSSNLTTVDKIIPASEIKQEKSESVTTTNEPSTSGARPKRTKGKGKRNLDEIGNSKSLEIHSSKSIDRNENLMKEKEIEESDLPKKEGVGTLNATIESIYEDAISDNAKKTETSNNQYEIKNCSVILKKIDVSEVSLLTAPEINILDSENLNNNTFNVNVTRTVDPGETFVAEKESNSTFVLPTVNGLNGNQKEKDLRSSLITDDESETEESYPKNSVKTSKNEIFNPLIQSPVRKKVQAFEQHAAKNSNLLSSPAATRVARVNSRVQDLKENRDTNTPVSRIPKPGTPGLDPKTQRYHTPKETTSTSIVNVHLKKKYNSTSKLYGMGSSTGGQSSKSSTSRENSVEDLKRSAHALQLAAEEKKRKREEKQKHAQQIREARDREKREAAERVAREKQEKHKKLLHEREEKARQEYEKKRILREQKLQKVDMQRNLEEIQRNLQIPKHLEAEIQKKKDLLDVARMKALRDDINRNISHHIAETSTSKPVHKQKQYDFDLLLSGDSTDEEEKQTTKKPPPPTWSLSKVRQPLIRQQSYIPWEIVDKLFSVQPMTIDLQEIFPTIDSRYLKRNSSVIWSTPPRYSELPKY